MSAEFVVARTRHGAILDLGDLRIEAGSPHIDRGAVRATLSVWNGALVYRNTVNLTSERSRQRTVRVLAERGLAVPEAALMALDEACRQRPPDVAEHVCDGTPDVSCTVPDLAALRRAFDRWLLIRDPDYLAVVAATVVAHELGFEPVWLLVVGPPSGAKTEVIRSLYGYPGVYPLSSLTPRTFASGLETGGDDPSLLSRLTNEIICVKDLTTIITLDRDGRQEIFSQLREIYDGEFARTWGTGKELRWRGRLGFIGGVTDIIDQYHAALAVLGERFVSIRPAVPDRADLARRALENAGHEAEMRGALAAAMHAFLAGRPRRRPAASGEAMDTIVTLADFVTRARSGTFRDGYRRELEYVPEPEAPARFAKQMLALASGLAVVHGREAITDEELRIVHRVGLDCIPVIRRRVITALVAGTIAGDGDSLSTSRIAGSARFSSRAVRYALEDLQGLGIAECEKGGPGRADTWRMPDEMRGIFTYLSAYATPEDGGEGGDDAGDGTSHVV